MLTALLSIKVKCANSYVSDDLTMKINSKYLE
jgi:hypothetical protein